MHATRTTDHHHHHWFGTNNPTDSHDFYNYWCDNALTYGPPCTTDHAQPAAGGWRPDWRLGVVKDMIQEEMNKEVLSLKQENANLKKKLKEYDQIIECLEEEKQRLERIPFDEPAEQFAMQGGFNHNGRVTKV